MTDSSETRPSLGEYLREIRETQRRTQRDVCSDVLSNGYVGQIEQGKIRDVSVGKLLQLCERYDISPITVLKDVYGFELGQDVVDPRAQQIGEMVFSLPEKARDDMLGWIAFQAERHRTPQEN